MSRLVRSLFVSAPEVSDPNGAIRRRVKFQVKNVKPIVVTDNIMGHFVLDTASNINLGHNHTFAAHDRIGKLFAIRPDDHRDRRGRSLQ